MSKRLLAIGVLKPGEKLSVPIQPPLPFVMDAPLAISNELGACTILKVDPDEITVENRTTRAAPFAIVALPKAAVRLLSLPWGQVAQDLAHVGGQVRQALSGRGLRRRKG